MIVTVPQVIEWLDCLTTHQHKCQDCPANPRPGAMWVYGCMKGQADIVQEAKKLLEKQVPKPVNRWRTHTQKKGYPFCPNPDCQRGLEEGETYCEFCGQAVDWNKEKEWGCE